jgi:hypothetical protein
MSFMREDRRFSKRLFPVFFVSALLCASTAGCGGANDASHLSRSTSSGTPSGFETPSIATSLIPPGQRLRGDGDADNPSDIDGNGDGDGANDPDNDNPTPASYRFPDKDDKPIFAYGHPPHAAEKTAIMTTFKRYYAAASTGDGAEACSLQLPSFARSVPENYAQTGALSYLRGGKTCQAVMSMLFGHLHRQLAEAVTVVEVRVEDHVAQVIFSSRAMPASRIFLLREGSSWKIPTLIGQPLS